MNHLLHGVARALTETFHCPEPVLEIGSYQVPGQESIGDLRSLFPGKKYVGLDMRPGPGVDCVASAEKLPQPDASMGTVVAMNTFEHVRHFWRGFEEIQRVLRPDGVLVVSCPFFFRIHNYPQDYWRFTPAAFELLLEKYPSKIIGWHGPKQRPGNVWAFACREEYPAVRGEQFAHYQRLLQTYARAGYILDQALALSPGEASMRPRAVCPVSGSQSRGEHMPGHPGGIVSDGGICGANSLFPRTRGRGAKVRGCRLRAKNLEFSRGILSPLTPSPLPPSTEGEGLIDTLVATAQTRSNVIAGGSYQPALAPLVSVCIVNWNCREMLRNCLRSLDQCQGVSLEVIVVDNGSSDGAADMVARDFPQVRLFRNLDNAGFARANNQAARAAKADLLFFLNNDTVVPADTVAELANFMQCEPRTIIVGPRLVDGEGKTQISYRRRPTVATFLHRTLLLRWTGILRRNYRNYRRDTRVCGTALPSPPTRGDGYSVDVLMGAAPMVRREQFLELGAWDEDFGFGGEDLELCHRARKTRSSHLSSARERHSLRQSEHAPEHRFCLATHRRGIRSILPQERGVAFRAPRL